MMEKTWHILHITDFHISNPNGSDELLRNANCDVYVSDLVKEINATLPDSTIDCIIASGDFVDSGSNDARTRRNENFSHAEKVLRLTANSLSVKSDNVYLCLGNHDLLRDAELDGDLVGARAAFAELAHKFGNQDPVWAATSHRAKLYRNPNSALILILDSTLGANGENSSGNLGDDESNEIIMAVKNFQQENELLIIASHHPPAVEEPIIGMLDDRDPLWTKNHLWWQAAYLHKTLSQFPKGPVLWLGGDVHKDTHFISNKMHTVVTGRFGTSSAEKGTQVPRQACVVHIPERGKSHSTLLEYRPTGHNDQSFDGYWTALSVDPGENTPAKKRGVSAETLLAKDTQDLPPSGEGIHKVESQYITALLDIDLQHQILKAVSTDKLYSMGRFVTCKDRTSISWIPIGALLNNGELLVAVIGKMASWIKTKFDGINPEQLGIVGIDSWGAVLASQISVMTGARNYCVAARAEGITHTESERVSPTVVIGMESCDVIILVSDVIGTGRSLHYVFESLSKGFKDRENHGVDNLPNHRTWGIISVICDEYCERGEHLDFADFNVTACKEMRMPVLSNESLPDKNILPPAVSFC